MSNIIHKWALSYQKDVKIHLPVGTTILHAGLDPQGNPCIWTSAPLDAPRVVSHRFGIYGTGGQVPEGCVHRGTFVDGPFVWHVFDEVTA